MAEVPFLKKKDDVIAAVAFRGVPEGTKGKVMVVNGLSWIRYWVRFTNGVAIGSIDRTQIATPSEWKRLQAGEDVFGLEPVEEEAADEEAAAGGGDGGVSVNGVLIPSKLIDRSKAARERLGA